MQLALPQLQAHLQQGLRSLYTVHGDEALLVQEACDAIRNEARAQGYSERSVHVVAGAHFDWSAVLAAGGSMSLFAERQMLEVRIPTGKPGKEGSPMIQQLAQSAQGNDSTLTLFILPRLDNPTKKGAWFGALEQYGVTLQIEAIDRAQLPQWIAQRLKLQNQTVAAGPEGLACLNFLRLVSCNCGEALGAILAVAGHGLPHLNRVIGIRLEKQQISFSIIWSWSSPGGIWRIGWGQDCFGFPIAL
jgi:DNA polymerase-3 subunit delta